MAVGDRLARAVRAADVRRAGAHRSAGRGRRGGPAAVRGALAADLCLTSAASATGVARLQVPRAGAPGPGLGPGRVPAILERPAVRPSPSAAWSPRRAHRSAHPLHGLGRHGHPRRAGAQRRRGRAGRRRADRPRHRPAATPRRLARAARGADAGHRRRALLPARRRSACTCWPTSSTPRSPSCRASASSCGTTGCRAPRAWSPSCRSWACPSPGSRSRGSPATARSAARTSPTALVELGVVATVSDAFTPDWLADGGRAYVEQARARPLRRDPAGQGAPAGSPSSRTRSPSSAASACRSPRSRELAAAGLDGIEVDHMDHDAATRARLRGLAADLGLLATGSSDYHGSRKTCRARRVHHRPRGLRRDHAARDRAPFPVPG